jgi:hypothetical protein
MRGSDAGITHGGLTRQKMSSHSVVLELLDTGYSSFVVAPLVVSYWRGTWNLADTYLIPSDKVQSKVASLIIGIIGHLVFTIGQGWFRNNFSPDRHRLTFYVVSRVYTSIFGIVCVNCWRGGWQLIDHYTAKNMTTILSITIFAIVCLMLLKTIRNVTATPFVVVNDTAYEYFDVPTMYKKSVRLGMHALGIEL